MFIPDLDFFPIPDPDPLHWFSGLPDPDPSSAKKSKETLDLYCFVTFS
jgi:hypothetical protein